MSKQINPAHSAMSKQINPAHSAILSLEDIKRIHAALAKVGEASLCELLVQKSGATKTAKQRREMRAYHAAAQRSCLVNDGEVEVDPDACLSEGSDDGAYVAAWVWVPKGEAK